MSIKIGILTLSSREWGGVFQYTLTLLEALKNLHNKRYEFIQVRYESFPKILERDIVIKRQNVSPIVRMKRLIYAFMGIKLGNLAPKVDVDFIISPTITLLPFYMQKPYVVVIHDFQYKYYPEFFTLKQRIILEAIYRTGKKANLVVCESNYVKRDIMRFLSIPEEKIKILLSPPPNYILKTKISEIKLMEIKEKYKLPENFLFYPANFWYHKNHINLLRAIRLIKDKYKQNIPLILVGAKENNFENVMEEIRNLDLSQQVKYLGYVPDEDMPYLYRLAAALVIPTLFESVSIPIWEAFYLGCPVVASNVCALPEQVGDAGLMFNPYDIEEMAKKIYHVWIDENLRKELTRKGYKRVEDLNIENYAKRWEEILSEMISLKAHAFK
jgi:glycosyltransferase involved in cell wall biosynthesis